MRDLGADQVSVLLALLQYGSWHDEAGWVLRTRSLTRKVLGTLVKRGMVEREGELFVFTDDGFCEAHDQRNTYLDHEMPLPDLARK